MAYNPPPPGQPAGGYGQAPASYPQPSAGYAPVQGQPPAGYAPVQGQPPAGYPPAQGQPPAGYPPAQGQPNTDYPPQQAPPGGGFAQTMNQPVATALSRPDGGDSPPPEGESDNEEDNTMPTDTSGLQTFEGYGEVGFQPGGYLPPPPPPKYEEQEPPSMEFGRAADITEEEARAALLELVSEHCCWGSGAAKSMTMSKITPSNAFHYTLETFCEGRSTARAEVPYYGDTVDGPFNGPPPLPWDIPCSPASHFENLVYRLPVPHTAEIRICWKCCGNGRVTCGGCFGRGRRRCGSCSGRGYRNVHRDGESHRQSCFRCGGDGRITCSRCRGCGQVQCPHCKGQGRVKNFIELTVTYCNHVTDYILEETAMPDELVRSVSGVEVFSQVLPQVWPIVSFPIKQVNDNSVRLVEAAKTAHPMERQLNQRQILRAVPVSDVDYTFKDTTTKFWVYGMERKVHAPDYPQQCCCECTIL